MATLTVNGHKVTVDDSFRGLSPDEQERTVNEIASSLPQKQESGSSFLGTAADMGASLASGVGRGAVELGMLPATASSLLNKGSDWLADKVVGGTRSALGYDPLPPEETASGRDRSGTIGSVLDTGQQAVRGVMDENLYAPRTVPGEYAETVGEFVPGALAPGPTLANAIRMAVIPGVASEAAGQATEGTAAEPYARIGAAILGGIAPTVAARPVSGAYRYLADKNAASGAAKAMGVSPEVAKQLTQTLAADGSLGQRGFRNMAAAGQEAMLADAGPNARAVLDTTIQKGGPGAVLARSRIDERLGRDSAALNTALDTTLGTPEGVYAAQSNIRNTARTAVNDAYNGPSGAYAQPIDYASDAGRRVEGIINRIPPRIANRAIQQANERMAYDEIPNMQIMANIADDGTITYQQMPNVMQADYIKRALNEIARDGTDIGGKMSSDAAFANRMANDLRDAVSEAVPEYATALRTAADPLSRQSAVELGASLLSPSMTRDQVADSTARYTQGQRDALAQGVRSRIDDVMANVTRTVQDGNTDAREAYKAIRELSSRANREKLTLALGEDRANPLFEELDRVAQSFNLRGSVAENSKTFARQATNEMLTNAAAPGALGTLGRGEPIKASKRVIQALTGQTDEAIRRREDSIASEIADYLTRPAAQAIPAFQAMQNFQGQTVANQVRASEIARLLSQGKNLVYPASGLSADRLRQ